jgi:redox-sensitive bicupin YhaK (pirin superfamily)
MSAGGGVRHSEFNHSKTEPVHFLQIWIMPDRQGVAPSYEQKHFTDADKKGRLRLIASKDGREGSVRIHQDASVYAAMLDPGQEVAHEMAAGRLAWLQVARGVVTLNGQELRAGDGAAVENETALKISSLSDGSEVLLFDLPR